MSSGAPFLPIEIISDILKRLPVKSLIRFQSVCNLWKNLIKSPSFIASHLDHSGREYPSFISRCGHTVSGISFHSFLDRDMQLRRVQNHTLFYSIKYPRIVGSCNGLLCVQDKTPGSFMSPLYLCNPAISEVIQVPRSRPSMDLCYLSSVGFAFSPTINDYKIVIPYVKQSDMEFGFEAYSVTTNSWKNIGMGSFKGIRHCTDGITLNGSMFWIASQRGLAIHEREYNVILSLDLAMDELRLILLPPSSSKDIPILTVYENRLAAFQTSLTINPRNCLIELWVIEEGIGSSWSKILSCGPYPHIVAPLTIWRNQIVYDVFPEYSVEGYDDDAAGSFMFDPTSNEVKVLCSGRHGTLGAVFPYVESLVPISNIHTRSH
ncbi:unnamed protein product [Cuscuta epithymum]|uniref:F-box domain-containing protein n=1 Tax=Cuscuta epithymum TaxID=186058 RepID=A0AAV0D8J6_9ASTE|nr:unnamed protein product [Cuscuta epithymum]